MKIKKTILSLLFCMVLVLTAVVNPLAAEAVEGDLVVYEQYTNVKETFRGDKKTAPTKPGYVFAGWYQENNENKPLGEAEANNASTAYAKFVDENVLSTKYQLTAGADLSSTSSSLRMLTTVDSLKYSEVGFEIQIGEKSTTRTSKTVYETIVGYVNGQNVSYQPKVFSTASNFFMGYEVTHIPQNAFSTEFAITPIWKTIDGTVVEGIEKVFTIQEMLEDANSDTVEVTKDGTIKLQNDYSGSNQACYVSKTSIKPGSRVSFDVEVTPAQDISVWFLGCDYPADGWYNEWYAMQYADGVVSNTITLTTEAKIDVFTIVVQYNDTTQDHKSSVVTIKNLTIEQDTTTVSEDGTITIQNAGSGSNQACYVSNTSIKKGSRVSFDVEVTPAQDISVWFLGCDYPADGWYNEWYAKQYADGVVSDTITLTTDVKIDVFTIVVQYNDTTQDHKSSVVTIKNLTIEQDTTTVSEDGTITLQNNYSGSNQPCYVSNTSIKKGSRVSFDVEVTPAQDISVWFLGCDYSSGAWENEWYAMQYADGVVSDTITLTTGAKIDVFTILVQYNDTTQDHKSSVVTIKNLTIEQDATTVSEDGTITIQNTVSGSDYNYYVCDKSLKAGDIITFEISGTPIQNTSVWFFGCDNSTDTWANEWYAMNYPTGVNGTPIEVTAWENVDVFTIQAQCLDPNLDRKQNVVTITNLKINGVAVY